MLFQLSEEPGNDVLPRVKEVRGSVSYWDIWPYIDNISYIALYFCSKRKKGVYHC